MISQTSAPYAGGGRRAPLLRLVAAGLMLCAVALCPGVGPPARAQQAPSTGNSTVTPPQSANGPVGTAPNTRTPEHPTPAPASVMQIRRDVAGELSYRFITAQDESAAPTPLPAASGASNVIVLPVAAKSKGMLLEVIDNTRGKVAHLPVTTSGVAPLTDADFNQVLSVLVPVQSKGRAVTNATVTLTTADEKANPPTKDGKPASGAVRPYNHSWLLKPSDGGVASFANVPLGVPITVSVTSGSDTPVSQTLTLPSNPPADGYRWQTIEVPWPTVHTVPLPAAPAPVAPMTGSPAAPAATTPAPAAPAPQPASNPLYELVNLIVTLAILGGFLYGLMWAYKQGHIKKMLDHLGIQTQPLATAGGPQTSPFEKPARTPIQPITEGTADPLAGAGFGPSVGAMPVVSAGPRLVATMGAYAGNIFPLAPTTTTDIGRDTANPVALPQDTNTSRRHATIQALNGQYTVTDNGSSNGTYVNGVRISGQTPQPLRPGDELQIGQTRFRFEA